MKTLRPVLFASTFAALLAAPSARAVNATWNGTTDALWDSTTNWSATAFPGTGDTATVNNAGGAVDVIDLGAGVTVSTILFDTFNAAAYTIGSGAVGSQILTLNNSGAVTMNATVTQNQLFNSAIVLGTDATAQSYTFTNNSGANSLIFAGGITGGTGGTAGVKTLNVAGSGAIALSGIIGDGGATSLALTKSGTGTLTMSGINTYTGVTTLSAGILRATTSASALGTGAATLSLGGGTLQLANDTGLAFNRNTTVTANSTILSDRLTAAAGVTQTLGTLSLGAFSLNVGAGAFNTSGTAGLAFGAVTLTGAGTFNTNNSFFNSGVTTLTTLASITGAQNLVIGGTGVTTITGLITPGGAQTLTKNGTGTLNLNGAGAHTGSGLLSINGGTVSVASGGVLTSRPLTFGGTGTFGFNAASAGATQGMGALTFTAGEGTVRQTYGTSGNAAVTFSSLAARAAGATGNFTTSGGANGTTNSINLTGAAPGFQNQGLFFNGANYAYVNALGTFVRAPVYGTDANFGAVIAGGANLGASSATTHKETTAAITAQGAASYATLKINAATTQNFTQTTGTILTLAQNGILRTGGGSTTFASSTATAATLTGTGELVIRTNAAGDAITFSGTNDVNITGFTGLTKTGAGTLTLGDAANTYTGAININGGVLAFNSSYNNVNVAGSLGALGARNIVLNGGTLRNASGATFNPVAATKAIVVGSGGGTFDLNGQQLQLDDASQLSGSGNLTLTNSSGTANTVLLGTGSVSYAAFLGNMIVDPAATGNITLRLVNANAAGVTGNTIVMSNNKSTLDLQALINNNIFVGGTGISSGGAITNTGAQGGTNAGATTTLTADTTFTTGNNGLTFNGVVTDAGRGFVLTKNGPSFLALNAANTYSGGTVIATNNSQQLALGNNGALGTGALTVNGTGLVVLANTNVVMTNSVILNQDTDFGLIGNSNNGTMTFGALNLGGGARTISVPVPLITTTFTGPVTNGTGLTLTGIGTLALSGTGSFTGPVNVNGGGTLSVGATTLNTADSVNIGTTLTSSLNFNADNIGAAATLASNATVALGGAASQALLGFQLGNTSNYDSLNLTGATGNVTVGSGGAVISITPLAGFGPVAGTNIYNLITTTGGGAISNFGNITLASGALPTGYNYGFTTSGTSAILTVTGGAAGHLFWRGDVNNSWNAGTGTGATDTNWNNAADAADALFAPNAANTVNFSSAGLAGATPVTTTLDQDFSVAGINVNNTNTGALTVNQGVFGTLTFGTGGITVDTAGPTSTTLNAPITLGAAQTWTVTDSGQTLSVQGAAPAQGVVSGAFGVTLAGAGKVTLGGFNTFSGGLTTGAGQLNINNGGSTTTNSALGTGTVNFAGATTTLDNTSGVAQSVLTTGAQTWGGNVVFTGTGSLNLGAGTIGLGAATRTVTVNGGTLQTNGIISSAASVGLIKAGTGALTLGGANTFSTAGSAGVTLNDGRLNINAAAALGVGTFVIDNTGSGVTIDNTSGAAVTTANVQTWNTGFTYGGSAPLIMNTGAVAAGTTTKTIVVNGPGLGVNTNALTLGGAISASTATGGLTKNGTGYLNLTGANGGMSVLTTVTLNSGTLGISSATALGTTGNTFVINGGALDASAGTTLTSIPNQTWNGSFAFIGSNNLSMGAAGTGTITAAPGTTTITALANTLTLGAAISNTNTPAITVNGGGILALTGDSLYTGTTTINSGSQINLGAAGATGSLNGTAGTALVLNGGVFNYTRTGTVVQNMAGVTVGEGRSVIVNTTATQTTALGAITRTAPGGTLEFRPFAGSTISTSTANTAGILGGWAVMNGGASWAVGNGAGTVTGLVYPTALVTNTSTLAGTTAANYAGLNIDVDNSAGLIGGTIAPNSLRFNSATGFTMTLAAGVNTIDSGGILVTQTAAGGVSTITGGSIAGSAGANGDLILQHYGTTGALNINSVIADNPAGGSTTSLTKSGTFNANQGIAVIGGSFGSAVGGGSIINTFTGSVFVNIGTLTVNGSSVTGGNLNGSNAGPLNQRPIILNGGILNLVMDGDATGLANAIDLTAGNAANSGVTVNGNAAINVSRLAQGTVLTAATPTLFTQALNKTIQMGALNFGNDGRTLTVNPFNGYGLEFTGTTTLDKNLSTINVGQATASNVVQGLTLSGPVTGTIAGGSWTKAGVGTLVLNNASNDFISNMVLSAGALAFNSDAALGHAANTITFTGATAATTLRAYGGTAATPLSIATSRTINLWGATPANNVIEVAADTTLTLNSAFGGGNSPLTKADLGTLVLNADNGIWAGQLSIAAGAVRVTNAGALGISTSSTAGNTVVAATGGALQLSGVSIWDQLNLTGSGIHTGGALQAVGTSSTSTTNGLITLGGAATVGADATNTLNLRGGFTGAQTLTFAGAGTINVDTNPIANGSGIVKIGSGTTTLAVASPGMTGSITVNAGTLALGGSLGGGAGSVGGFNGITINYGGTLSVDNSVGTGISNRLGGGAVPRAITLNGGSLSYTGHASVPSSETLGALTLTPRGESTITVTAGANAGAGLIFGTVSRDINGGTALFRGSSLGTAPGAGVATIASTIGTGFTFTGAGAAGTITKGILPWALVDASASGTGTSFATADTATGNLRALSPSEYVSSLGGLVSSANLVLGAADRLAGSSAINSLTLTSTNAVTLNPLQTLTVGGGTNLGGILNTAATSISGGLVTSGGTGGVVFHANADLTLDSVLVGSAAGANVHLTKTGAGILTLNKANAFTGQTAINQGTLRLAGGNNTLFYSNGNSYMTINGGTLDLNGNSQQVHGLFTDGTVAGAGGTIIGGSGSTLVTNSDGRNWAGTIGGSVAFQRGGNNTATTFYSDNTYSGATRISGGTITLQDSGRISNTVSIGIDYGASLIIENTAGTQALTDRVRDAGAISMRGGILTLNGRANTKTTETVGVTTLTSGGSLISMGALTGTVVSSELTVTRINRAAGEGTITFNQQGGTALGLIGSTNRIFVSNINGTSTSTLGAGLTNNIIGPWAVVNATDWASYNPTTGVGALNQAGYAGYSNIGTAATASTLANAGVNDNVNLDAAVSSVLSADKTVGTVRIGNVATQTIDINATRTLTLGNGISGGLLHFSTANQIVGTAPSVGTLTSGGSELFIFLQGTGTLTVNSVITGATTLIKSSDGAGTDGALILAGTNTYTGGTVVNVSGLTLAATGTLPAPTSGAGLTLNNGSFTQTALGTIASQSFVLNGASTATLAGANSLTTLTFNMDGGAQTGPTVATGASALTLTGAGGITAGGSNPNALATISGAGGLNLNGTTNYAMAVNGFSFNSQLVAPLNATLSITAPIANGGIVKTGDGLLSLGGANTFASGVDLQTGGIAIANNGALGTVGASTLTISGNNTTLTADATGGRTVGNNVTLGNSATTVNLGNYGAGTLTLAGATTWSTTTGVARTLNVNAVTGGGVTINPQTLAGVITSAGTGNGIVKTGIGTLAITGNNAATLDWTGSNAVTVNNGLLQINADTALGAIPGAAVANNIVLNGGGLSASAAYTLNVNRGISLGATNGVIDTSFAITIPGTVGGGGGLVKSGTGALTLSGLNTFTGAVFANAGSVNFTNATAPTFTGLSVAGGAALNMLNGVGQAYSLGSGALNLGAGTGAASLGLEMLNPTTNDRFTTTGAALTANTVILNMTRLSGATGGTFTLLSAASGLNNPTYVFNPAGWALSGTAVSATAVQVTATPVTGDLFWAGAVNLSWGGLNGSFDSNFSTDLAGTNAKSTPGIDQGLTFSANGMTAPTLSTTLDINSSIRDLTFSNNVGSGPLGTITIAPGVGGTLSITPAVSTAGIHVQAGAPAAINLSAPVTLGANQTWSVADAATVLNVSGNITGTANLIKDGGGIVQLGGANTYVGTTTVNAGVLRAGAANAINPASAFTVGAAGTLRLNGFSATVASLAGSAGGIVENFSGTGAVLTAGANNSNTTYAGAIQNGTGAGTLGLTKLGTGTLTLTGTNTYTGLTTVDAGTLALSANTTTTTGQYLIANAANSKGILTISTGTSLTSTVGAGSAMRIGVGANSVGVVTQNGGSVTLGTVAQNYNLALGGDGGITNSANTNFNFGAYNMNGGTASAFQTEVGDSGGVGMMTITDGTFGNAAGARHFIIGRFGNSVGVVTLMGTGGATPTLLGASATLGIGMGWSDASNNNRSELNVGNLGLVDAGAATNGILWRANGTNNLGIVNLLTGGTIQAGTLTNSAGTSTSIVNLNGGTLRSTQSTATFMTNLTSVYVYSGGAIIDTNGFDDTVQALLAPTGNGVTLTGGTGSGYLAAPYVKITGDGVGATAIATIDGSGNITGFTLTNPGVGYTNATVTLVGGGGTGTAPTAGFAANTSGGLTKQGLGTLTLTGGNTYTGATTVSAGTLIVNNTLASSAIAVDSAATLGGIGTLNGAVTINSGGRLSPATGTTGGTLTLGSLTLAPGSQLAYEFGGTPDLVAVTTASGLTLNGGALSLYATGGVSPLTVNGTYNLFNYTTGFGGALTNLSVANSQAGKTYAIFDNVGVSIQLVLGTATSADWSGTINGDWTNDGPGNNWNGGAQPNSLGAVANFGNLAGSPQTVTLNGGKTVGSILFNNANSFIIGTNTDAITLDNGIAAGAVSATLGSHTINAPIALNGPANITPATGTTISFGGIISGTGRSLTFSGAGASTLNAVNTYSGGTTLSAGTLNLGNDSALGSGPLTITAGIIDNTKGSLLTNANNNAQNWNGSFTFTGTESMDLGSGAVTLGATPTLTTGTVAKTLTVGGVIDDGAVAAGLTKAGPGTLVLNGNNGYDGLTTMNAGVLTLAGNNSGAAGGVTLTGGLLNINNDNALGSGRLTLGSGTFDTNANRTVAGSILQTWSNAATAIFTGTNALNLGTGAVNLGTDATTGSFTLTNNSALAGTSLTVGGNISAIAGGTAGVKTLTIAGPGSTALTGNITKGGATSIAVTVTSAGTTTLSGAASLINTLNVNGGATSIVELGTGILTINNGGNSGIQSSTGGTINATGGGSLALGVSGDNNGTANGTTLTINAPITGAFQYESFLGGGGTGIVVLANPANSFTGGVFINSGVISVAAIGNSGNNSPLGTNGTISLATSNNSTLMYTGTGETTNKIISLASTTIGGTLDQSGPSGNLNITGNFAIPGAGAKTLFLQGSTAGTGQISGAIINNSVANTTGVTKAGTGTWTLSGANTYTGATTVSGGRLVLSGGSVGTGTTGVTVSSATDKPMLLLSGATSVTGRFQAGSAAGQSGAIYQTTGTANAAGNGGADNFIGSGSGGYGFYQLSGGNLNSTSFMSYGNNGGTGLFYQTGGAVALSGGGWFQLGYGASGNGVAYLKGGSFTAPTGQLSALGYQSGAASRGEITIDGTMVTSPGTVTFGATNSTGGTGMLNLRSGTLEATNIVESNAAVTSVLNFNGGTFKAAAGAGTLTGLNNAYVHGGGAIIDTSLSNFTISQALLAPAGDGVATVPVTDGGGGYIGAPYVQITGGGSDATAVALMVDDGFGNGTYKIDSILVTNPGTSYASAPFISLVGGSPSTAASLGAATTAANVSGGLTKQGANTLTLSGANTYSGGTTISLGTIQANNSSALGSGSVSVAAGARLSLNANSLTIANNITLEGTTTNGAIFSGDRPAGNVNNLSGQITLNATSNISTWWNDKTLQFSGKITGTGGLNFDLQPGSVGGRYLISGATNDYAGATSVTGSGTALFGHTGQAMLYLGATNALPTTSPLTLNNADLYLNGQSQTLPSISGGGSFSVQNGSTSAATLILGSGDTTSTFSGSIQDNGLPVTNTASTDPTPPAPVVGTVALTKTGNGTLTLSGTNGYTGATLVSAGTLLVNGSQNPAAGLITVSGGATLGGTGTMGDVTIQNGGLLVGTVTMKDLAIEGGGTLAPGNSEGKITTTGNLVLNETSNLTFELKLDDPWTSGIPTTSNYPTTSDYVAVGNHVPLVGNLTLNGKLTVTPLTLFTTPNDGDKWLLMSYGGALTNEGLDVVSAPSGKTYVIDTSIGGSVFLVAVPEAGTAGLLALGLLLLRRLRRAP